MSILEQIQSDLAAKLLSEPYTRELPIFVLRKSRTGSEIDSALSGLATKNGKSGITITVLMPLVNVDRPNAPGPAAIGNVSVRVIEAPDINMSGGMGFMRPAEEVALAIAQILHHFHMVGIANPLTPARQCITPKPDHLPLLAYDVSFDFMLPLEKLVKLGVPTISPSSGALNTLVTLSHAAPGVKIYYTLDGSFPVNPPPNAPEGPAGYAPPAATLYTVPFAAAGSPLRCAAYLEDYLGSDPNFAEFS